MQRTTFVTALGLALVTLFAGCSNDAPPSRSRTLLLADRAQPCGNGICDGDETHESCSNDCCQTDQAGLCVPVCGNGYCDGNETHDSCAQDCCETTAEGYCVPEWNL